MTVKLTDLLIEALAEQEQESAGVDQMLERFKILRYVLEDLLTSTKGDDYNRGEDLGKLISKIDIIVFKPTTFKITFKNGASMNLKYDPTPMENDPESDQKYKPRDYFWCQILGKKYSLGDRSEYTQALDYISQALASKPIGSGNNQSTQDQKPDQDTPEETPDETPEEPSEETPEDNDSEES